MKQARYQISINGFDIKTATWDDALQRDGKGDEVHISWATHKFRSDGSLVYPSSIRKSRTIGDVNGHRNRANGGSASDRGGLQAGDRYPHDMPWLKYRVIEMPPPLPGLPAFRCEVRADQPPGRDAPPMICFDDAITADQVVYFTPMIIEEDDGGSAWEGWVEWLKETDDKFGLRARQIIAATAPTATSVFDAVSLGIQTAATLFYDGGPAGQPGSRPIGMTQSPDDPKRFVFNPHVIELTIDQAEALVAADPSGCGKGVIVVPFADDRKLRGDYQLYVQLERIGEVIDR